VTCTLGLPLVAINTGLLYQNISFFFGEAALKNPSTNSKSHQLTGQLCNFYHCIYVSHTQVTAGDKTCSQQQLGQLNTA